MQAPRSREEAVALGEVWQMKGASAGKTHEPRKAPAFAGQAKKRLRARFVFREAAEKAVVIWVSDRCGLIVWK